MKKVYLSKECSLVKRVLLVLLLLMVLQEAQAQKRMVTGKVTDSMNEPLPGVNVLVSGTTAGTVTDIDGKYLIDIPIESDTLIFSFVGFWTERMAVGDQTVMDVSLMPDVTSLSEIVVIGYGVQRKEDLTGAVSSTKSDKINKTSASSVVQALAGRLSGVQVIQGSGTPGGDVSIRVRGTGTINDANPLYVVDGVPVAGGIWYLSPASIESIDVLKDASATAIYGSRGANGVIMVTTKKGKEGTYDVTVDYSYGVQKAVKTYELLTAEEYAGLHNKMRANAGLNLNPEFSDPQQLGVGTDWLDKVFESAPMQRVNASISSGNNKIQQATSLEYYKQDGILKNTSFERVNLNSNISADITNKFKIISSINISREKRDLQDAYTVINNAMRILPTIPIYDENGNFTGPTGNAELNGQAINPVGIVNTGFNKMAGSRVLGNVSGEYKLYKGLTFKSTLGVEQGYDYGENFSPKYYWGSWGQSNTTQSNSTANEALFLWDNTLSYEKEFGLSRINALIGTSYQTYNRKWMHAAVTDRASDMTTELDNGITPQNIGGNSASWALLSYMGRVHYSYDDRYFATATLRIDGSSRFGKNNRYGTFPSLGLAWNMKNEDFMRDVNFVNLLKVRASYGLTGNQNIDNYAYADQLSSSGIYNFGSFDAATSTSVPLIFPLMLPNPNIRWESVEQYNVGIDAVLLERRIEFNADFYVKNTMHMLVKKPVPQTAGYSLNEADFPPVNVGNVKNTGTEFSLTTRNIERKNLQWATDFNISFNKNEVVSLGGRASIFEGISLIEEGQPIRSFYGYQADGIYQTLDEVFDHATQENRAVDKESHDPTINTSPGDIRFKDTNKDGVINDDDRVVIGNPNPDFTFGFGNTISYKNIQLSFLFQGVYGNDIYNAVRVSHEGMHTTFNQLSSTLEHWEGEGTSNSMPRPIYADPNGNTRASSRFIEDGSFIKLRNVTLSYNAPEKWINALGIRGLQFYVNANNVFTLTNYSGIDPEVGVTGVDYGIYPPAKTFLLGAKVNF